jgi:hypothetical protein
MPVVGPARLRPNSGAGPSAEPDWPTCPGAQQLFAGGVGESGGSIERLMAGAEGEVKTLDLGWEGPLQPVGLSGRSLCGIRGLVGKRSGPADRLLNDSACGIFAVSRQIQVQ